jgi:hypothetical protein
MNEEGSEDDQQKKGRQHQAGFAERLVASRETAGQRYEFGEDEEAQAYSLAEDGVFRCD